MADQEDSEESGNIVQFPLYPGHLYRRLHRIAEERGVDVETLMREAVQLFVDYDKEQKKTTGEFE